MFKAKLDYKCSIQSPSWSLKHLDRLDPSYCTTSHQTSHTTCHPLFQCLQTLQMVSHQTPYHGLVWFGLVRVGLGWCEILHGVLVHKTRPSSGLGSCDRCKLSWFILEDCLKDNISYLDPTSQPTLFSLSFSLLPRRGFHRVRSQLVWAEFFTNNPIICNMLTFIQYLFHPIIQPLHQIQNILIMLHLTLSDLIWTHLVQSDWAWSLLTWLEPPWSQWPNLNLSDPIYHCLNPL